MASAQDHTTTGRAAGVGTVPRGDTGAGLFSLAIGFLVFMIMVAFAMQVLLGLFARTVTAGAAFDAAQYLARHPGDDPGALQVVNNEINPTSIDHASNVSTDANFVDYEVQVHAPTFLSGEWWQGSK